MQKLKNFIIKHKINLTILSSLVLFFILFSQNAYAGFVDEVNAIVVSFLSFITQGIVGLLGAVLSFFMIFLVDVASYDGFANAPAITTGWVLMRDLANMGIVIGLLIIAFGSAFSQSYELSKGLVKLLITAVIVNFSKLITLFLIDVSQVVMLSFVNSFRDVGMGNIISILGIEKFFDPNTNPDASFVSGLMALLATAFLLIVAIGTVVVLTITLVTRVVYLWILIVMSPMAFAVDAIPVDKLKQINSKWWETFTNYLIIGPFLAFFIWLTFVSLSGANAMKSNLTPTNPEEKKERAELTQDTAALGKIGEYDQLAGFVIAIAMLLGGLKASSDVAGSAGQMASNWGESSQGYVKKLAESAKKGLEARVYEGNFVPQRFQKFVPKIVQQGLTSAARLATERGRSEASELLQARVERVAGGAASAGVVDEVKDKQQAERQKDLETQQVMNNKSDFNNHLKQVIQKGDAGAIRAAIAEGSKKWGISQENWDAARPMIEKDFGGDKKGFTEYALDIQKENKKHGNPLDTTDQIVDDQGNAVPNPLSKNDRMKKILGDMSSDEMKKYMGRTDALEGGTAQVTAKISAMAENANLVGKLSTGERNKMRTKIEERRNNKDYWDSLTAEQKEEHEKLYEAAGAVYDDQGRRDEVDEYYFDDKGKLKSRKVKSTGSHLEATRADKEPGNAVAKKLNESRKKMNDKKLSDSDRAVARQEYEDAKKEHERMQAAVKDEEKIILDPEKSDSEKNSAQSRIKSVIDAPYSMSYDRLKLGSAAVSEEARERVSNELKKDFVDKIGDRLKPALDSVSKVASVVVDAPGNVAYIGLDGLQDLGEAVVERFADAANQKIDSDAKALADSGVTAQRQANATFLTDSDMADLKTRLEEMKDRAITTLGSKADDPSGTIENGLDVSFRQLLEKQFAEAEKHIDSYAADVSDKAKKRTAQETVNEFIVSNSGSKEAKRKNTGFLRTRNSASRQSLGKAHADADKAKKSNNADAVNQLVESKIALLEQILQEAQDNGADNANVSSAKKALKAEADSIRGEADYKDKLDRLQRAIKTIDDAVYTGRLFSLRNTGENPPIKF